MNYASFGGDCYDGFIAGLSAVSQNPATSRKYWHYGSSSTNFCDGIWSNTTQVNYALLGGRCANGFLAGFSAVCQYNASSDKYWNCGSDKHKNKYCLCK